MRDGEARVFFSNEEKKRERRRRGDVVYLSRSDFSLVYIYETEKKNSERGKISFDDVVSLSFLFLP